MHTFRRDRQRRPASFETRPPGAPQDDGNLCVATISYRHLEEARSVVSKGARRPVRDRERFPQDIESALVSERWACPGPEAVRDQCAARHKNPATLRQLPFPANRCGPAIDRRFSTKAAANL